MENIIFVHGLGQTDSSWDKTLAHLPEYLRSGAITLDLCALCQDKEITYDNLYRAFKEYCNRSKDLTHFCGISLGAILVLNYAIEYPEKVNSLVLIAAQYKIPYLLMKFQSFIMSFMPKSAFQEIGFSKTDFSTLTKSMAQLDFSCTVKNISCPSLIVCGKKDKANMKASTELAALIPDSKLYFIENAGHEVNVDTPEELASILISYLP